MRYLLLILVCIGLAMPLFGQAAITVDYNHLPITHLLVPATVILAILGLLIVAFTCGVTLKWRDKEIAIGGIKHLLAKLEGVKTLLV